MWLAKSTKWPQDGEASERPSDVASEDDEAGEVFWEGSKT